MGGGWGQWGKRVRKVVDGEGRVTRSEGCVWGVRFKELAVGGGSGKADPMHRCDSRWWLDTGPATGAVLQLKQVLRCAPRGVATQAGLPGWCWLALATPAWFTVLVAALVSVSTVASKVVPAHLHSSSTQQQARRSGCQHDG
jgi:hypothetical protein